MFLLSIASDPKTVLRERLAALVAASQSYLQVQHVRVFELITSSIIGSELRHLYGTHEDTRTVPMTSPGCLTAAARGETCIYVQGAHKRMALSGADFDAFWDAPEELPVVSALQLPLKGSGKQVDVLSSCIGRRMRVRTRLGKGGLRAPFVACR